jgi:hypothetical protein
MLIRTKVSSPYFNDGPPSGAQSLGVFMGDGGDDDYLKLVVTGDAGEPALEVVHEVAGVPASTLVPFLDLLSTTGVSLVLHVDPASATVQPYAAFRDVQLTAIGGPVVLTPGSALHAAVRESAPLAVGIIATSRDATPFTATWDFFEVALGSSVGVPATPVLSTNTRLLPVFPNPIRSSATLRYELQRAAHVTHEIFDLTGARIRTLERRTHDAGAHAVTWDATDAQGRRVAPGVYYQKLEADGVRRMQRVVVLK